MSRFAHVLRRADERLRAPEPARSRILLELAQDLDDLYRSYRARGLSEAESVRRAEALLGASDEAVDRLGQVHRTAYDRLLERLPSIGGHPFERLLLTVSTLAGLVFGAGGLLSAGVARRSSPVVWLLLAVAAAMVWTAGVRWFELSSRAAPRVARPRARLAGLLALAVSALAVGALGSVLELYMGFSVVGADPSWLEMVRRVGWAAELLAAAMGLSMAAFLAWFHLDRRAACVEAARSRALRIAAVDET